MTVSLTRPPPKHAWKLTQVFRNIVGIIAWRNEISAEIWKRMRQKNIWLREFVQRTRALKRDSRKVAEWELRQVAWYTCRRREGYNVDKEIWNLQQYTQKMYALPIFLPLCSACVMRVCMNAWTRDWTEEDDSLAISLKIHNFFFLSLQEFLLFWHLHPFFGGFQGGRWRGNKEPK